MSGTLSFVDTLLVTVVGITIVFLGLVVLIFLIKALVALTEGLANRRASGTPVKTITIPTAPPPPPPKTAGPEQDEALIAAITAAIACMMEENVAFTVRRVRRIPTASPWQRAGREDQIRSREFL